MLKTEKKGLLVACASCGVEIEGKLCVTAEGRGGKGCPTLTRKEVLENANQEYDDPEIMEFARQASIQEAHGYANRHQRPYIVQPAKPRIIEICEFAKKMGYRRLGLAFCVALGQEAEMVEDILKTHGFEVASVCCKAGRTSKEGFLGLKDEDKVFQETDEATCNPINQAKVLNHEKVEFNVLVGLCVGHDSLFFKYAEAPTTVLAAKDRVTGHNPLAAVYTYRTYYQKVMHPEVC